MSEHDTLQIHETAIVDAAFKIACDLAARLGLNLDDDVVENVIRQRLRHQLHLQRTWCPEDEELGSRQLWSRPVQ